MEIYQEQYPKIPNPVVINDPKAAHNQTVVHKQASILPKVQAEIGRSTDPNEVRTIPLRSGPIPPEFAPFPKFMWHPTEAPKIVNSGAELQEALDDGYMIDKPVAGSATADDIRARIKAKKKELQQLEDNLAAIEG